MPPRVPSDLRTLAGSCPHDATVATDGADNGRHLLSTGALTGGHEPGRSAAGWRRLTAKRHLSIVIRQASDPYAGPVVNG